MTKQHVIQQAKELSKQDQVDVALDLWDAVDSAELTLAVPPELQAELDHRDAIDLTDATQPADWKTLRAELLRGEI